MTSRRPYRGALDMAVVKHELELGLGTQFDPAVCSAVLQPVAWTKFEELVDALRPETSVAADGIRLEPPRRLRALREAV